jgi:hypothetical protein
MQLDLSGRCPASSEQTYAAAAGVAAAGVPGHAGQADSIERQAKLVQGLLHAHTMRWTGHCR